jgi:hypothetical protein
VHPKRHSSVPLLDWQPYEDRDLVVRLLPGGKLAFVSNGMAASIRSLGSGGEYDGGPVSNPIYEFRPKGALADTDMDYEINEDGTLTMVIFREPYVIVCETWFGKLKVLPLLSIDYRTAKRTCSFSSSLDIINDLVFDSDHRVNSSFSPLRSQMTIPHAQSLKTVRSPSLSILKTEPTRNALRMAAWRSSMG